MHNRHRTAELLRGLLIASTVVLTMPLADRLSAQRSIVLGPLSGD